MESRIKRGDVFSCDFGKNEHSIQTGIHPVLVIQADEINDISPTVVVATITNAAGKAYLPTHVILPEGVLFAQKSMVMLEQIHTVDKYELKDFIGIIDDEYLWKSINRAVKKAFGLWVYKNGRTGDVRCLCPNCLNDYKQVNGLVIKRLNPFQSKKDRCDKCNGQGYDYIIYDKKRAIK